MLRAFITTWSAVDSGNGRRRIVNPISNYIESTDIGLTVTCSVHYPDRDIDGLPDKNRVLAIVWQQTGATNGQGQNIESFASLPGVYMLPAFRFTKPIEEIPQSVRDTIIARLQTEGIPISALADIAVYGDFLKKIVKYFQTNFDTFGAHIENESDIEFE